MHIAECGQASETPAGAYAVGKAKHGAYRAIGLAAMTACAVALRLTKTGAIRIIWLCLAVDVAPRFIVFMLHSRVGSHDPRQTRTRNLRYPRDRITHDRIVHSAQPTSTRAYVNGV